MASAPKPEPQWVPMTATELLAIRGTPAFDQEIRRQARAIAEHDRRPDAEPRWEPDWEALDKRWQ